jgi:hypothetical protein
MENRRDREDRNEKLHSPGGQSSGRTDELNRSNVNSPKGFPERGNASLDEELRGELKDRNSRNRGRMNERRDDKTSRSEMMDTD